MVSQDASSHKHYGNEGYFQHRETSHLGYGCSSPFFLRPCLAEWVENRTGQAAAKVHFDILVRTVTSSSLEYNAAASSGASASIGSERSSTSVCN